MLPCFTRESELPRLESEYAGALQGDAQERLVATLNLSWAIRQRDARRCHVLVTDARELMRVTPFLEPFQLAAEARITLIEAELAWLLGELQGAYAIALKARQVFESIEDNVGMADSCWLLGWIHSDQGNYTERAAAFSQGLHYALACGDRVRVSIFHAVQARWMALRDVRAARAHWAHLAPVVSPGLHPGADAWIEDFHGLCCHLLGEMGKSIAHHVHAFESAQDSGQIRAAIVCGTNIGESFRYLNDHVTELDWMRRSLELARRAQWPRSYGACLMHTGETMRVLGRLGPAQELLDRAFEVLGPLKLSRTYALALQYMGALALDRNLPEQALDCYGQLEARARALEQRDLLVDAFCGRARAEARLERAELALAAAREALKLAEEQGDVIRQVTALTVLGEVHANRRRLPAPPQATNCSAALYYFSLAHARALQIENFVVPGELLDAISQEYAQAGNYEMAYLTARRAAVARERTHCKEATNRAVALQVSHETEAERAHSEYHRQLAELKARRVEELNQMNATLAHLAAVGKEINASLEISAVCEAIYGRALDLLDATALIIYLVDDEAQSLRSVFGVESGQLLPMELVALDEPSRYVARCARERTEVALDFAQGEADPMRLCGTLPVSSALYSPLVIGSRLIGVMTLQTPRRHAYRERERLVFNTLCAYGAVGLANAQTYQNLQSTHRALKDAQAQLEEMTLTDPLTGLRNRRFLMQHLDKDIGLTLRHYVEARRMGEAPQQSDLIFFLIDVDHFKAVNDEYGHAAGDVILTQMRARLEQVFRESDYLVRWGGEEFLAVARFVDRDQARTLAERVRSAVAGTPFTLPDGQSLTKTCSIGVACFPYLADHPHALEWSDVIEVADQALYRAKDCGRNAWVAYHATDHTSPHATLFRILHEVDEAIIAGELRIQSNRQGATSANLLRMLGAQSVEVGRA